MSQVDTDAVRRLMDRLRSADPAEAEVAIGHLIDWADVGVFERAADELDALRAAVEADDALWRLYEDYDEDQEMERKRAAWQVRKTARDALEGKA